MAVTFEAALADLEAMFPQWDKGTLELMLQENGNHVEHTIDAIFRMEGGGDDVIASASSKSYSAGSEDFISPQYSSSTRQTTGVSDETLRGSKIRLPDDFLQAPQGWKENNETFGDQQLALLLQNEMFQREVESTLGADFFRRQRQQPPPPGATGGPGGPAAGHPPGTSPRHPADVSHTNLGILKGLSGMGGAAKRNLTALAHQFSRNKGSSKDPETTRMLNGEDGFTHNPFRHDDDTGEDEVIVFENPASHLDLDSPSKSRDCMRVERGMFSDRGTRQVSAHDILTQRSHESN